MNFKLSEYTRIILFTASDTQTSKKAIIRVLPTAVEPTASSGYLFALHAHGATEYSWKLI